MKINENYQLRQIGDIYIIVSFHQNIMKNQSILTTNESGAFLWNCITNDCSKATLIQRLMDEYEIDETTAKEGVESFLCELDTLGALDL